MTARDRAKLRYRIAQVLLIYGLSALVAIFPLAFLTWGSPQGAWVLIFLNSGLLAIAFATVLGVANLILLRRNPDNYHLTRTFE